MTNKDLIIKRMDLQQMKYKQQLEKINERDFLFHVGMVTIDNLSGDTMLFNKEYEYINWLKKKAEIIDTAEKEYLSNVIFPYRKRVDCIIKSKLLTDSRKARIIVKINRKNGEKDFIQLPIFNVDSMYINMELEREYTLEELGL